MRALLLALTCGPLLAGCGGPEYPQFGDTSYRIEGVTAGHNGGPATHTVVYRDGKKMRVEAVLPSIGPATIVFDETTHAAYVLNPLSTATSTAAPAADGAAPAIGPDQGVAVRIEDSDAPQPLETAWAALGEDNARSTGPCEAAGESGFAWTPRIPPAPGIERAACITPDGIVLRVTENGRVLWEATELERGRIDAALFGVPAGYRMLDPHVLAQHRSSGTLDDILEPPADDPQG